MLEIMIVFSILQLADIWTTNKALSMGGREINPVMRWLMAKLGVIPALVWMKAVVVFIAYKYIYPHPSLIEVFGIVTAFYVYVIYNNFKAIKILKARG